MSARRDRLFRALGGTRGGSRSSLRIVTGRRGVAGGGKSLSIVSSTTLHIPSAFHRIHLRSAHRDCRSPPCLRGVPEGGPGAASVGDALRDPVVDTEDELANLRHLEQWVLGSIDGQEYPRINSHDTPNPISTTLA